MSNPFDSAITWLNGFDRNKSAFPDPWKSAPEAVFSKAKMVAVPGAAPTDPQVTVGISSAKAIQAIFSGACYIGVNVKESTVCVEYPSPTGKLKAVAYDYENKTLRAGMINPGPAGGPAPSSILPVPAATESSTAFVIALLAGEVIWFTTHGATLPDSTCKTDIQTATNALLSLHGNGFVPGREFEVDMLGLVLSIPLMIYNATRPIDGVAEYDRGWVYRKLTGLDSAGYFARLNNDDCASLASGCQPFSSLLSVPVSTYTPELFVGGSLTAGGSATLRTGTKPPAYSLDELQKELQLSIHALSPDEKDMVPTLGDNYVVDETLLMAARLVNRDWHAEGVDLAPNILLEGDSGSGKTVGAKFFAQVLGMPYTKMTMSPTMESANLIGAFYPVFNDVEDWSLSSDDSAVLAAIKQTMEAESICSKTPKTADIILALRRAFALREVREAIRIGYQIPTAEEVLYDTESAWQMLGHGTEAAPDAADVQLEANAAFENQAYRLLNLLIEQAETGGVSYRFILSELMRAFENGWLLEIQEAASVLRPGVLTELNSLLELNGRIEMPNGRCIYRHPDTIVVITTNSGYAGNMDLNESLRDRCMLGLKMDLPPAGVMAERAMAQTGFDKAEVALAAAIVVTDVAELAKSRNIKGSYGMRSLTAWMLDLKNDDMSEDAFRMRVVFKMTTNPDDVALLMDVFKTSNFASKVARRV